MSKTNHTIAKNLESKPKESKPKISCNTIVVAKYIKEK